MFIQKTYFNKQYARYIKIYKLPNAEKYTFHFQDDMIIKGYRVNQELCDTLIKHNYTFIDIIPKEFHTMEMYNEVMNNMPSLLAKTNMKDNLRREILNSLIKEGIDISQFSKENLKHLSVDNLVSFINKSAYSFNFVPKNKQKLVLKKLPHRFFTTETLDKFFDIKMDKILFNKFFGHIPLYRLTEHNYFPLLKFYINTGLDDGCGLPTGTGYYGLPYNNITWDPDQFIKITEWKYVKNIQRATISFSGCNNITFLGYSVIDTEFEIIENRE